jgi:YaiO family outer membrane protein
MLLALLLTTLLGAQAVSFDQAEALANQGQYDAALDAFRRVVAANPGDLRGRLWIARLHMLMGNPELAEPVYRSVTLEDPASLEATIGLGNALTDLERFDDAIVVLQRAEKLEPRNVEVLSALATAHRMAGNTTRALLYGELAVQLVPTPQTRQTLEQARMVHDHRVEVSSFGEQYNTGVQDTGSVDLRVNVRVDEHLRVMGRGQYQRKFRFSEQRGGGGLEWRWRPETSLFTHVLLGPDNVVLPRVDVNGGVAHTYRTTLWTAGYRFFDFANASVSVLSPAVTWWPTPRVSLGVDYHLAITNFDAAVGLESNHSGTFRVGYQLLPRLWVNGSATRGTENFETLSPDRIGNFQANTVAGGARIDMHSLTSILGVYEHQWRPAGVDMDRFSISLVQRF